MVLVNVGTLLLIAAITFDIELLKIILVPIKLIAIAFVIFVPLLGLAGLILHLLRAWFNIKWNILIK